MMHTLACSWALVFERDLLASLEGKATDALADFLLDFRRSCTDELFERALQQCQLCLKEAQTALRKTVDVVQAQIKDAQKDVSRLLAPTVRKQMNDGYQRSKGEKGPGSVARRKVCDT